MSYDLCKRVSNQVEVEMPYSLRQRKPNQVQGAMTENEDEEGTLLIETPHDVENRNLLENSAKRSRTKRFFIGTKFSHSQGSTSGTTCDNVLENPSSNEETVHKHPGLSKLKPPSRSNDFSTEPESLMVLKLASSVLISNINEAEDANKMIDLSSQAFAYLDSIRVDYTQVYKAVYSVISHQCDKEALDIQKLHPDFQTKAAHDQEASEFCEREENRSGFNRVLKEAQHEFDGITARVNRLSGKLKKAKGKQAKAEAKVAAARADKVACDEAYSKAKSKLEEIAPKMSEAQMAIDEFETRWKETVDGLDRAMEELLSLKSRLQ